MPIITARIGARYQVVIPKAVREALNLRPKDTLLFIIDDDTVLLRPRPARFTDALLGLHRELWPDPDTWLEDERALWEQKS